MIESASQAVAVTPSDAVNLPDPAACLYVGTKGDVSVTTLDGGTVVYKAFPGGSYLFQRCRRVNATGTTATDILAIYG
jgi:hypothetical protein